MSNYVKSTDFASKDDLATGNPLKLIKGSEVNTEFNSIQTAIATKADLASPAFTGNPTVTTQAIDNSSARLANTEFVQNQIAADFAAVDITGGTIDGVAITGGTLSGLTTDLAVADGGTGASTLAANAVLLGNGTSTLQTVAPGTSGNLLTSDGTTWQSTVRTPVLGEGQSWATLTLANNTNYTNTTSKPIMINAFFSDGGNTQTIAYVDGVDVGRNYGVSTGGYSGSTVSVIVPVNSVFKYVLGSNSSATLAVLS